MDLNEYNAGELLRTLPQEPPRPPSIDVRLAMHTGRRRRAVRRSAAAGAVGLTLLAVAAVPVALSATRDTDESPSTAGSSVSASNSASPVAGAPASPRTVQNATAPTSCRAERLPIPDNVPQALVTAADPTGRLLFGVSEPSGGVKQVVLWQGGKATKIDIPGDEQTIESVNASGVAVGESFYSNNNSWTAWLYQDGKVTKLPGGDKAQASGINASGVIVGNRTPDTRPLDQPLIWRTPTSQPQELALPAGATGGHVFSVDDDGTAVGSIYVGKVQQPYVWAPDGTGRQLPHLNPSPFASGTPKGIIISAAFTVRNGWATGIDGPAGERHTGMRWDLRAGTVELVPGMEGRPITANASGWMIGTDDQGRAVLYAGDKHLTLPDGFIHKPGDLTNGPETISDDGKTIGGQADDKNGTIHAIVWHCS